MNQHKRYLITAFILKPLIKLYCYLRFNLHTVPFRARPDSQPPYLILANHNSDFDPFFIAFCFDFPIYFVASDHILRMGFLSKIIKYLVSPIPKLKPTSDTKTIKDILSTLRAGKSVCVFPEGNRSWNGETGYIAPSIGKLAIGSKAALINFRIEGAYLAAPRWADNFRRGKIECKAIRELSPAELGQMKTDEINNLIAKDLFIDAMITQKKWHIPYKGKNLAQSIETVLYTCPLCGRFTTIRSKGDQAYCDCGLRFNYDLYGYLNNAPFKTILAWDRWQKENIKSKIKDIINTHNKAPIFSDQNQSLLTVKRAEKAHVLDKGEFFMYSNRFVFSGQKKNHDFFFNDITHISIRGRVILQFTVKKGVTFEVKSKHPRSAYKYLQLFETIISANT